LARAVNQGEASGVNEVLDRDFSDISCLMMNSCRDKAFSRLVLDGYRTYLEKIAQGAGDWASQTDWLWEMLGAFNRFQLLTPLRKGELGVDGLNRAAADILHGAGLIPATHGWYSGRPVMVTRNDYNLGLMNGDIGIAVEVGDDGAQDPLTPLEGRAGSQAGSRMLRVVFPMADRSLKQVLPSRLEAVETVYAMTVHKSQGSEFDHTALVLPGTMSPVMTRELVYTGITRARSFFTLAGPSTDILARAVSQRTHRASGLGDLLRSGS